MLGVNWDESPVLRFTISSVFYVMLFAKGDSETQLPKFSIFRSVSELKLRFMLLRLCDWPFETKVIIVCDSFLRKSISIVYCLSLML